MPYTIPKGTHDISGDEAFCYREIEELLQTLAHNYGYMEMRTPIFEQTELFTRSVGESSDVVRKEMYTFEDKGGRSMTLRPELTAGIMRSIVSNKLYTNPDLPIKSWYLGPIFRYERPQAGRYRQFSQFGIEVVGVDSPYYDAEVIFLGYSALKMLGFGNIELRINSLGDKESRDQYRVALKEYFKDHINEMCEDCQKRYEINPLRILDCKVPEDQEIAKNAPVLRDYLSSSAKEYFQFILNILDNYEIPYVVDDNLVRGLDYYSQVVFEFHYTSNNGKYLGAVGAGGHYDNLLAEVGGPKLSGVGLAFGIERIYNLLKEDGILDNKLENFDLTIMPLSDNCLPVAFDLAVFLRGSGYRVDIAYNVKSMKQQFKRAERKLSPLAIIVGEDELDNNQIIIRDLNQKTQINVNINEVLTVIDNIFNGHENEHQCCCHEHEDECHEHNGHHCCSKHHHEEE